MNNKSALLSELEKMLTRPSENYNNTAVSPFQIANNCVEALKQLKNNLANSGEHYQDICLDFDEKTALQFKDMEFIFIAIAIHAARIYFINKLLQVEKAGKGEKEKKLKGAQKKVAEKRDVDEINVPRIYYAPLKQIYEGRGVPYDATQFDETVYVSGKPKFFKGANHRFSTLGHDPVLGLFIGTANIITNTITVFDNENVIEIGKVQLHKVDSYHVKYEDNYKNPKISFDASTLEAIRQAIFRIFIDNDLKTSFGLELDGYYAPIKKGEENGLEVFFAALFKQLMHIATDLFTPCGISLPFIDAFVDKRFVEKFTKEISFGDVVKQGLQAFLAWLIDTIIKFTYRLTYKWDNRKYDQFAEAKALKIVAIANMVASGSSVLHATFRMYEGDIRSWKDADIGGFIVALRAIYTSEKFKDRIREEFISNELYNRILKVDDIYQKA